MPRSRGATSHSPHYGTTYRHVLDMTMEVKGGIVQDGGEGREVSDGRVVIVSTWSKEVVCPHVSNCMCVGEGVVEEQCLRGGGFDSVTHD